MFESKSLAKRTADRGMATSILQQERAIMALGAQRDWPFRVLGVAPVPAVSVYHKGWWLVPVTEDNSQIPARTLERVRVIYEAGIRPHAFIIAHETSDRLPAPKNKPVSETEAWAHQMARSAKTAIQIAHKIAEVVMPLAGEAVSIGAMLGLGLVSAMAVDPCLIAVTEDNVWIQIDYWME